MWLFWKNFFQNIQKKLKIGQYIKIPLEERKQNSFNYLSKRSTELIQVFRTIQRIRKHHLALFTVTDVIVRFMREKMLKLIAIHLFTSVAQQPNSALRGLILEVSRSHTIGNSQSVELPWTSDQSVAQTVTYTAQTNT